jgi:hypothetical protein
VHIAAIVMYTFDICLINSGCTPEDNFYFLLNNALRRRESAFIKEGGDYMYYLMVGLESLPAYTGEAGGWLWRGISAEGRDRLEQECTLMRQVISSDTFFIAENFSATQSSEGCSKNLKIVSQCLHSVVLQSIIIRPEQY